MNVKMLPEEKKSRLSTKVCECATQSYGTQYFPTRTRRCSRFAAFEIDGVKLCKQHAGDACLAYMLKKQDQEAANEA